MLILRVLCIKLFLKSKIKLIIDMLTRKIVTPFNGSPAIKF